MISKLFQLENCRKSSLTQLSISVPSAFGQLVTQSHSICTVQSHSIKRVCPKQCFFQRRQLLKKQREKVSDQICSYANVQYLWVCDIKVIQNEGAKGEKTRGGQMQKTSKILIDSVTFLPTYIDLYQRPKTARGYFNFFYINLAQAKQTTQQHKF